MKVFTIIFCFLLPIIGFSQNPTSGIATSDPEATKILDQISSYILSQSSIQIDFTLGFQTNLNAETENQKGVLFQSGEQYFLAYANQTIVSDGTLLWVYQQDFNEVSITNVDKNASGFMLNPSQFLSFYKTMDVRYAMVFEGVEDGKQVQKIELKPLDSNQIVSKLRMTTNKAENKIVRIKAFLKDGSVYTLQIDKYTLNPDLETGLFTFDPTAYEGIHVEDLRID
jgi:outer membrane lipoprotein-sorting protein